MQRMRAGPVVPVELAWRWGRNSRHKLAGNRWFMWTTADSIEPRREIGWRFMWTTADEKKAIFLDR